MMESRLERGIIDDTTVCDMLMRVGDGRVDVVVFSPAVDNSLIYASLQPPVASGVPRLKSIEETVYDNPLLLSEFRRTWILVEDSHYMIIPAEITDEADYSRLYRYLYPEAVSPLSRCGLSARNASIIFSVGEELDGFLKRTFPMAVVMPHIAPLVRYTVARLGRGNSRRMLVNMRAGDMDIIAVDGNNLLQANTFRYDTVTDAAYMVLASREECGLKDDGDELLFTGHRESREALMPLLRTYVPRVMPAIFPPQMFRLGKDAMSAPFDLIITPLCE